MSILLISLSCPKTTQNLRMRDSRATATYRSTRASFTSRACVNLTKLLIKPDEDLWSFPDQCIKFFTLDGRRHVLLSPSIPIGSRHQVSLHQMASSTWRAAAPACRVKHLPPDLKSSEKWLVFDPLLLLLRDRDSPSGITPKQA